MNKPNVNNPFAAIICDMDGTLVDSENHWLALVDPFLQSYVAEWSQEKASRLSGLNVQDTYSLLRSWGVVITHAQFREFCDTTAEEVYLRRACLFPGVLELLQKASLSGLKLGLASASEEYWVQMALSRFDLRHYFGAVASANDVVVCKPAPDIYLLVAKQLGVKPEQCLVIEDTPTGIAAATKAGMFCVAVTNTYPAPQLAAAHQIVHNLAEIIW